MTAGLLLFILLFLCFLLLVYTFSKRKQNKRMLRHFSSMAEQLRLNIGSQEIFKLRMIGIDCISKKVVYLRAELLKTKTQVIDLDDIIHCTYRKIYLPLPDSNIHKDVPMVLSEIVLEFDTSELTTISVPFFHYLLDHHSEAEEAELKAQKWESMLRKILSKRSAVYAVATN